MRGSVAQPDYTVEEPASGFHQGRIYGYYDFVEAVSDLKHPKNAEMIEWIGRPWDINEFDLDKANSWLREVQL